ncbi:MAG: hypothetical protein RJQ21_19090 [Rhodospirillales bacterium]
MSGIRVLVATTAGPSEVQRLTREDPDLQSVICLNGRALPLPVSRAYDAFVRKPTGIVERIVGHPVFRADVAAPVTDGASWQLGLLIAHLLDHRGRFCGRDDLPDALVWATGEVDRDLRLHAVDGMEDKVRTSLDAFRAARAAGIEVHLVVPEGNRDALCAALGAEAGGLQVHAPAQMADLDALLGSPPPPPRRARLRTWLAGLALLAVLAFPSWLVLDEVSGWRALGQAGRYGDLVDALDQARTSGGPLGTLALAAFDLLDEPAVPLPGPDLRLSLLEAPRFGACPHPEGLASLSERPVDATTSRLDLGEVRACALRVRTEPADGGVTILAGTAGGVRAAGDADILLPIPAVRDGAAAEIRLVALRVPPGLAGTARGWAGDLTGPAAPSERMREILRRSGGVVVYRNLTIEPRLTQSPGPNRFN